MPAPHPTPDAAPGLLPRQRELVATLGRLPDAQARLAWLVDQARRHAGAPDGLRVEAHLVGGCLARLWLECQARDGCCWFRCDSDSLVVKAVAGLLCEFYSGHKPAEIVGHPPQFLADLGIRQHLTPNRRNGLARVWDRIRTFAESCEPAAVARG